jgi:hypothetical protein
MCFRMNKTSIPNVSLFVVFQLIWLLYNSVFTASFTPAINTGPNHLLFKSIKIPVHQTVLLKSQKTKTRALKWISASIQGNSYNNDNTTDDAKYKTTISNKNDSNNNFNINSSRRNVVGHMMSIASLGLMSSVQIPYGNNNNNNNANAAVGTLPELVNTDYVLQGITVRVNDKSQLNTMIQFLQDGFNFNILRRRIRGSVEEVWLGFGPEQLAIPNEFTIPISSFSQYGGHASICIVYDSSDVIANPYYRIGDDVPGNNIAYVQVSVPGYRVSQMVANGGTILDAYGIVDVVSPVGLPIRGIVGIVPDPIMFIAINCIDVKKSQQYYEQIGFTKQEYPFARPSNGTGQFEPPQPKRSIYLSQSSNCLGILLLQSKRLKKVTTNPVVQSLNIVYSPNAVTNNNNNNNSEDENDISDDSTTTIASRLIDPSGVPLRFQPFNEFEQEEKETRYKAIIET